MITTLPFAPTKKELFKLLLIRYLKKRWWLYLVFIVLSGFYYTSYGGHDTSTALYFLIFAMVLPLSTSFSIWRYLSSKDNRVLYLTRHYKMDFDNIENFLQDGSTSSIKIGNFIKSELIAGYYLLYMTRAQYYMIPISTFKSPEDLKWFTVNILGKIKMPGFL